VAVDFEFDFGGHKSVEEAGRSGERPRPVCMVAKDLRTLIACHNASMECYRRAMIRDQTFEGRRESLSQANNVPAGFLPALNLQKTKASELSG
jgi:hypothetical protein